MKPNNDQLEVLKRYVNLVNLSLPNHYIESPYIDGSQYVFSLKRKYHKRNENNSFNVRKNNIEECMSYLSAIQDITYLK